MITGRGISFYRTGGTVRAYPMLEVDGQLVHGREIPGVVSEAGVTSLPEPSDVLLEREVERLKAKPSGNRLAARSRTARCGDG